MKASSPSFTLGLSRIRLLTKQGGPACVRNAQRLPAQSLALSRDNGCVGIIAANHFGVFQSLVNDALSLPDSISIKTLLLELLDDTRECARKRRHAGLPLQGEQNSSPTRGHHEIAVDDHLPAPAVGYAADGGDDAFLALAERLASGAILW